MCHKHPGDIWGIGAGRGDVTKKSLMDLKKINVQGGPKRYAIRNLLVLLAEDLSSFPAPTWQLTKAPVSSAVLFRNLHSRGAYTNT